MHALSIDHEIGLCTYAGPKLKELAEKFGAVVVHLDQEHDLYFLCEHPATKEWAFHSVVELMQPTAETAKITAIGINTK